MGDLRIIDATKGNPLCGAEAVGYLEYLETARKGDGVVNMSNC